MKQHLKHFIVSLLVRKVRRLRENRQFWLIAVAGSIGKTSTKLAIARLLSAGYRVAYQEGNYNDTVTVPLVFFGLPLPSLFNPFAWLITLLKIELQLHRPYKYDVVVVELGTDHPGMMAEFQDYIHADIGVLTSIAPEHMEFFGGIDAVAKEELVLADMSSQLLLNRDLVAAEYVPQHPKLHQYGSENDVEYKLHIQSQDAEGQHFAVSHNGKELLEATYPGIAEVQLYSILAAVAVADRIGMEQSAIKDAIGQIRPVSGRLQLLKGINGSTIIDDTYNASPEAVKLALQALYDMPGSSKIALLGNMNELGGYSPSAHGDVGALCDPARVNAVVTLGPDANEYLAAAAEKRGCAVMRCDSPYDAAEKIKPLLKPGTVLLAKGSQNGVFAEETVKQLLANPDDATLLVRQSTYWLNVKRKQFGERS